MSKIQIRKGAFETNSSSAHCLVITKSDEKYNEEDINYAFFDWNYKEEIKVPELYFARTPFRILSDFTRKFYYVLGALSEEYGDKYWNICEKFIKKYTNKALIPNKESDTKWFKTEEEAKEYAEVINSRLKERNLLNEFCVIPVKSNGTSEYWKVYSYKSVYVEDYGNLKDFLIKNNLTIEEFLLSKKYVIIIDGDEYYIWRDVKDTGIINEDIEEIQFN